MPQNIIEAADTYDVTLQAPLDGEDANVASLLLYMQGGANRLRFLNDRLLNGKEGGTVTPTGTIIVDGAPGPNGVGMEVQNFRVRDWPKISTQTVIHAVPVIHTEQTNSIATPPWEGGFGFIEQTVVASDQFWIPVPFLPQGSTIIESTIRIVNDGAVHGALPANMIAMGFVEATSSGTKPFLEGLTDDPSGDVATYEAEHDFTKAVGASDQPVRADSNYYIVVTGEFSSNSQIGMQIIHASVKVDISELRV